MAKKPNVKLVAAIGASLPDLSDKATEYWLSHPEQLAEALNTLSIPPQQAFSYHVTVDYSRSVEQLVNDGKYDWSNSSITGGNFPSTEKGKTQVEIYLVSFDHYVSSEQAIKEMSAQGLRPATLKELLSLGIDHPDLQRNGTIVALGSTRRYPSDGSYVPYLGRRGSGRYLGLIWWDGYWDSEWRFAAVRISHLEPRFL